MFKIGEFSKLGQVSIRMLRYYDETGILKPAEIDELTGYRNYSVDQIPILNKIRYLRDSGFSISEIIEVLRLNNDKLLFKKLDDKQKEINANIELQKNKIKKIKEVKKELLTDKNKMCYEVLIKSIPSYEVLSLRRVIKNYYCEEDLWQEIMRYTKDNKIKLLDDSFSIYHDEECKESFVDVELCCLVDKKGNNYKDYIYKDTESILNMACMMVYGDFSNISKAYFSFAKWLQKNSKYEMQGPTRQIVHRGPWNEKDPQKYLIELQIPLKII
ncbi:MAG: effector binding domain-containing protein [Bacilli bacterium]|nr:effector binding domain-containing protein [Bacilli bacterium]